MAIYDFINDLGRLQQSAMGKINASNLLLRLLDQQTKIMKELEIRYKLIVS